MKLFDDYLPRDGEYDMRRDTTGLPKALANRINNHICFKGGGGGSTVTSSVPDEWKPQVTSLLNSLTGNVDKKLAGEEDIIAGFDPRQKESLDYQTASSRDRIAGRGAYDMEANNKKALQNLWGVNMRKVGTAGSLGSARSDLAMNKALAGQASQDAKYRTAQIEGGIDTLGKAGTAYQKQSQNILDAEGNLIKGALGSVTGAAGTTKTSSGGGK